MFKKNLIKACFTLISIACCVVNGIPQTVKNARPVTNSENRITINAKTLSRELRKILSGIMENMNNITMVDDNSLYYRYMKEQIVNEYLTELDEIDIDNISNDEKVKDIIECIDAVIKKIPKMKRALNRSVTIKGIIPREGSLKFIDSLDKQLKLLLQQNGFVFEDTKYEKIINNVGHDRGNCNKEHTEAITDIVNTLRNILNDYNAKIKNVDINSRYYKYVYNEIVKWYLDELSEFDSTNVDNTSVDNTSVKKTNVSVIEKLNDILGGINSILCKIPKATKKLLHSRSLSEPVVQQEHLRVIEDIDIKLKALRHRTEKILSKCNKMVN